VNTAPSGASLSVTISGFTRLFGGDVRRVLDVARAAEDAGVDQLVLPDHVVMGPNTAAYPYGTFPYGPSEPWPEPLTLLAAMAAVTERVRLGTGILVTALRPAAVLAKTAATLDVVSGGRLDLGVGLGWQREEYAALGVPWSAREARFDDHLRACVALWTEEPPVSFQSATVRLDSLWCEPRPLQREPRSGIPLWFGVPATDGHAERIARLGRGWLPIHTTDDEGLGSGIVRVRDAFVRVGRDPDELGVRAALALHVGDDGSIDAGAARDRAAELVALGVTTLSIGLGRSLRDVAEVARFLHAVARLT
jgi:probable F420-dependent oxidoreductase